MISWKITRDKAMVEEKKTIQNKREKKEIESKQNSLKHTYDHIHKYTESSLDFPTLASAGENKKIKKIQWTPEKTTSSAA